MKFENLSLNSETRKNAPGDFIELSMGYTHYQLSGEGRLVVFVHGFSVPSFYWEKNFDYLVKNGYRALRYDLYGRGYSDRPKTKYDENLFVDQLNELLNKLELTDKKIILIGLSMGGAIAVIFSRKHPDLVQKLILIAPAGLPLPSAFGSLFLKIPLLNRLLFRLFGNDLLINDLSGDYYKFPDDYEKIKGDYQNQMIYKGFRRAILSTINNFPMADLMYEYELFGKLKKPTLLIWGDKDLVLPFKNHKKVEELIPNVKFFPIIDAGHAVQYEKSYEVNEIIVNFLKRK